jgi:predicted O-linked N-acetylglucosamine transferase (SPINDLY family)
VAAGCDEFIAKSAEGYRDIAVAAARDVKKLADIRAGMRSKVEGSPLGDVKAYVLAVEAAYRQMWRRNCAGHVTAVDAASRARA